MKPITSILLIAAIVCYVFLPFLSMDLAGSITGLSYSAGLITENFSLTKTIFALLPFIACFGGIMLNYNKHRLWSIGTAVFIVSGIVFFSFYHFFYQSWSLHHDPELIGDQAAVIEGFTVKELCIGYYASSSRSYRALSLCCPLNSTKHSSNPLTIPWKKASARAKKVFQKCITKSGKNSPPLNQK